MQDLAYDTLIRNEVRRMNKLRTNRRVKIYSINSKCIFPVRSLSGDDTKTFISYLIWYTNKDLKNCYRYGFEFDKMENTKSLKSKVKKSYNEFQVDLRNLTAKKVNLDGGDLGRADGTN